MIAIRRQIALGRAILAPSVLPTFGVDATKSQLVEREIQSKSFAISRVGVSLVRKLVVFLPVGHHRDEREY